MRTDASGTSSSSAASMGKAVCTPCPISLRGIARTTEPSEAILIQPLSATAPSSGNISAPAPSRDRWGMTPHPTTSAPAAPAALNSQARRLMTAPLPPPS